MSRARLNLLIDAVIGIAFLVTAVTGVVFLLPLTWQHALGLGMPGMLGVSLRSWHWLHDWSGVVATAGVLLHFALHYRWVAHTTRRWLGESQRERAVRRPVATTTASPLAQVVEPLGPRDPHPDWERQTSVGTSGHARLTRRGFVTGAIGVGAALAGGVVLVKAASAIGLGGAGGSASSGASGSSSSVSSGSSGGQSGSTQGTTTQARVSVDAASCIGCGRCLQTCPASVFAWNGNGRATAQSPDQCILCHRCVQVCPASAITLNA